MSEVDKVVFGLLLIAMVALGVWWKETDRAAAEACRARAGTYVAGYCLDVAARRQPSL